MPASQVMSKFRRGKLHSGSKHGPRVTSEAQAKAIQISEARDEGYDIPKKGRKRGRKRGQKSGSKR
jgi:hypothetical protein